MRITQSTLSEFVYWVTIIFTVMADAGFGCKLYELSYNQDLLPYDFGVYFSQS